MHRHLGDPEAEGTWINEPGRVFAARRGRSELTTTILQDGQVRDLVERMLKTTGRRVDLSTPFRTPEPTCTSQSGARGCLSIGIAPAMACARVLRGEVEEDCCHADVARGQSTGDEAGHCRGSCPIVLEAGHE